MTYPVSDLPSSIRVGAFDFSIHLWSMSQAATHRSFGCFSCTEQRIYMQCEFARPEKALDTLLHELLHAIWWAYGIEDGDKEERTMGALASAWVQIFRDNPGLVHFIEKTCRDANQQ